MSTIETPLKLLSFSINGIGPYTTTKKLELRPLTVICGKNASGKSTWLKNLTALSYSAFYQDNFPCQFVRANLNFKTLLNDTLRASLTNGRLNDASTGNTPLGGYRLEVKPTPAFGTGEYEFPKSLKAIAVAFSHPLMQQTNAYRTCFMLNNKLLAEIDFDSALQKYILSSPEYLDEEFVEKIGYPTGGNLGILMAWDPSEDRLEYEGIVPPKRLEVANEHAADVLDHGINLLRKALNGYFHIGAIRPITIPSGKPDPYDINRLHVGLDGSLAKSLAELVALHPMSDASNSYRFVDFYSHWLSWLLGITVSYQTGNGIVNATKMPTDPTGFLLKQKFSADPDGSLLYHTKLVKQVDDLEDQLSAGFHQIAPIIVQAGLLPKHATLAIENPEAHLHPGLQLKLTEFLIKMAGSGRQILIETQSDLVIRRVLRAVFSEELPQQAANIYFASSSSAEKGSNLKKLELNGDSSIVWPRGFLDDDVAESTAMLNSMYGSQRRQADEPDEE